VSLPLSELVVGDGAWIFVCYNKNLLTIGLS
jgi:hypothetical protein